MPRPARPQRRRGPTDAVRRNRALWESTSGAYERRHRASLGRVWKAWGVFRIPERTLQALGSVRGLDVLEYGCGAARWSIALAREGARVTALDFSARRLAQAAELLERHPAPVRLLRADARRVPLADASFDLVFCDWGAMTFVDPHRTVPEVARLLRRGGRFVFTTASPFRFVAHDLRRDRLTRRLQRPYFGLLRLDFPDSTDFQLTYSDWISLFRAHGLAVERLREPRPAPGQRTSYVSKSAAAWARSWPVETLWELRKEGPRRGARPRRRLSGAGRRPRGTRTGSRGSGPRSG